MADDEVLTKIIRDPRPIRKESGPIANEMDGRLSSEIYFIFTFDKYNIILYYII